MKWCDEVLSTVHREGRSLLFLDNLAAHRCEEFTTKVKENGFDIHYLPANCTQWIQPIDHHIGQMLKTMIAKEMEDDFLHDKQLQENWIGLSEKLSSSAIRILVAKWSSRAWNKMFSNDKTSKIFERSGFETGCLVHHSKGNTPSNYIPIKIDGIEKYDFSCMQSSDTDEVDEANCNENLMLCESDNEEIDFDTENNEDNAYNDESDDIEFSKIKPPEFELNILPNHICFSSMQGKIILILIKETKNLTPGWLKVRVVGMVSEPSLARRGFNVMLKGSSRLDPNCSSFMNHKDEAFPFTLNAENHKKLWFYIKL